MKILYNKSGSSLKCWHMNYANEAFVTSQKKNSSTAIKNGNLARSLSYSPSDLPFVFYWKNRKLFKFSRGNGYWIWKPYLILKTIQKMKSGEFLFYTDSGCQFITSCNQLLKVAESISDIMVFELPYLESEYTKRDTFKIMNLDESKYFNTNQRLSGYMILRKSDKTIEFLNEWIRYQKDHRVVTDQLNVLGHDNYANFIEHRHDQSIFSLLSKKYNFVAYRDPSQFGLIYQENYSDSIYPQVINSDRVRDIRYNRNRFDKILFKIISKL